MKQLVSEHNEIKEQKGMAAAFLPLIIPRNP